ncbi:MAG: DUF3793 family protein [Lachnospiraceae bacterium]|nr:DUF3793 family protein [Lachnospiraceae bacterium]
MLEDMIIEHCSPTLAGIKTGNMFSMEVEEEKDLNVKIRELNLMLKKKGIRIIPLKRTKKRMLIYLYRPEFLKRDLKDRLALEILRSRGYTFTNPECCIAQLVRHLMCDEDFPHEIGLFLGYPPSDVEGFINDPCKGVKCCGCWKAYSDPEKAKCVFDKFNNCREVYRRMIRNGKSLEQLAVDTERCAG